ncbi:hypothetical protein [Pseudochryseolinea flava]|uniref:Uncharacterized protein n=1 Tax=Pseudochryseolinea flava TaxID=2059302 RepID=A0A364Y6C1_9BACT|nr:hypothetical protein [Pseudochryseolinea flava]RAW01648.1 hypothetical protein DQQ10_08315 [Pseudochryseolinea flava]
MFPRTLLTLVFVIVVAYVHAQQIQANDKPHNGLLSNVPAKRQNVLTRLVERSTPFVVLQYQQQGRYLLVDITPGLKYQLSEKLSLGLGWNRRVAFNEYYRAFSNMPRTFGPRSFLAYDMGWGLSPRIECEMMNAPVPPIVQKIRSEFHDRQWVPGVFIGVEKGCKLSKHVRGNLLVMVRTFNPQGKGPYNDVINIRLGVDVVSNTTRRSASSLPKQ